MFWFWCFLVYSFLGFLLEVAYATVTHGRKERKCLFLLPLCPVYGLGACAILSAADLLDGQPLLFLLWSAAAATGAEYLFALFYQRVLGVSFWDYRGIPGNLHGRICLPFSLVWALLSVPLARWIHPALCPLIQSLPAPAALSALVTVAADGLLSATLLKRSGDPACLAWHRQQKRTA